MKLFQDALRTLPSVGPPTLLAYRPELSQENTWIEVSQGLLFPAAWLFLLIVIPGSHAGKIKILPFVQQLR